MLRSSIQSWLRTASALTNPGRRGAAAMLAVAFCAALGAGAWVAASQPRRISLPVMTTASVSAASGGSTGAAGLVSAVAPSASSGSSAMPRVVVDVVGKVRRPGVYRLPPGSRVEDAVRAAGGAVAGADLVVVNLARKLTDGEQVAIGVAGASETSGGPSAGSGTSGSTGGLIDLNTATAEQLDVLPGVGPVLAQHIVDWRAQHGRFSSVGDLNSVSGIGDAKFADLKPLVTVS